MPTDSLQHPHSGQHTVLPSLSFPYKEIAFFLEFNRDLAFSKAALGDILKPFSRLYHLFVCYKAMQAKKKSLSNSSTLHSKSLVPMLRSRPGCLLLDHGINRSSPLVEQSELRRSNTDLLGERKVRGVEFHSLPHPVGNRAASPLSR